MTSPVIQLQHWVSVPCWPKQLSSSDSRGAGFQANFSKHSFTNLNYWPQATMGFSNGKTFPCQVLIGKQIGHALPTGLTKLWGDPHFTMVLRRVSYSTDQPTELAKISIASRISLSAFKRAQKEILGKVVQFYSSLLLLPRLLSVHLLPEC